MKRNPLYAFRKLVAFGFIILPFSLSAQLNSFWNTNGNAATNGNFIGTTNNEPLIFKTNSLEALRIKPNGEIKVASFENLGKGVVTFNNNGVLTTRVFPNDTNQVFCGSGNFKSVAALSGWTRTGNVLYNSPGVKVGIGTNSPQNALDVVGSASFTGTVSAQGVILTNKLLADTMRAGSMFSLNNNLQMSAGGLNEIYTTTGALRFQSNAGNSNNTIFSAGTNGRVGIGTYSPQYKLDVVGSVRFENDVYVSRLRPLPGDSVVLIGDSSIVFGNANRIYPNNTGVRGISMGNSNSTANGINSLAFGTKVRTNLNAPFSIVIGSGLSANSTPLENTISNSLMIGFNSNKPTIFVGPANGVGTVGKVGVGTSNPQSDFQIGDGFSTVHVGSSTGVALEYSTSYLGFNLGRRGPNDWFTSDDFANNGGSAIVGDIFGNMRFVVVTTTLVGAPQSLDDQTLIDNTAMQINRDGRVVIGKQTMVGGPHDNSFTKLTVDGKVVCRELFVTQNSWADSIFYPEHVLMPLSELKIFIDSAGHLPNVPTQTDIQTNGSNVGRNEVVLLAKVEELTLYLIQLQEQNAALQKRIENLERETTEARK